ncbi:hypothetical protein BVRB_5g123120 [Beta vulgaris subsp. vulgaris]|uniref:Uncharacterized protein n=1 Tax=Beta vulgaris subsp. vulgaris TaxID=3555 RepID=A0A0J8BD47_BETVV|nr:hypothetical protein BVRB_5g123120 [Beta vulgaris subsp. vulgaris]
MSIHIRTSSSYFKQNLFNYLRGIKLLITKDYRIALPYCIDCFCKDQREQSVFRALCLPYSKVHFLLEVSASSLNIHTPAKCRPY